VIPIEPVADIAMSMDFRIIGDAFGRFVIFECRVRNGGRDAYRILFDPERAIVSITAWVSPAPVKGLAARTITAFRPAHEMNHVAVTCKGTTIAVTVNDEPVLDVQDAALPDGVAAFGAGAFSDIPSTVEARFDNMTLWRP
jgi:hypothetical protein